MSHSGNPQPPTILLSEVRAWCAGDSDCESAVLHFVPGAGSYLDRVRMEPVSGAVQYINFHVPAGCTATYWDTSDNRHAKEADGDVTIQVKEAIFTRVV